MTEDEKWRCKVCGKVGTEDELNKLGHTPMEKVRSVKKINMTEDDDLKDFEEWWSKQDEIRKEGYCPDYYMIRLGFREGRRTLREKRGGMRDSNEPSDSYDD
jgi:hypothetical protein